MKLCQSLGALYFTQTGPFSELDAAHGFGFGFVAWDSAVGSGAWTKQHTVHSESCRDDASCSWGGCLEL